MMEYFFELRARLIRVLVFFVLCFGLCAYYSNALFAFIVSPLVSQFGALDALISVQITGSLLVPLRLAVDMALLLSTPFFLWQVWCFLSPGLYLPERRIFAFIVSVSLGLFGVGVCVCYLFVLPSILHLLQAARPAGVLFMPDMGSALHFILHFMLMFGLCFQLPLISVLSVRAGVMTREGLIKSRPYAIVLAFILGMLLTPPDVLSQIMLAIPLCVLYELGIVGARFFPKPSTEEDLLHHR